MNELLSRPLEVHGGIDRWNQFERVNATIVHGGQLWSMKGIPEDTVAGLHG